MTSEGLGEMFEGDSADMCADKFPLVLMGGRVEGLACADPGARTPIGASGNFHQPCDGHAGAEVVVGVGEVGGGGGVWSKIYFVSFRRN